ncbi:GNAT family N-acetyltransferase [Streptomyces sp. NPDC058655]|uniref:GNAT family N-acetyltransferase n=1 Tax=unclassified Streptomyces TaxID=2593676 RepID=UPI00366748AC
MITLTPRTATRSADAPVPTAFPVRSASPRDAAALAALSRPFVRSGALRARSLSLYASDATDFLVVDAPDGTLQGALGLRAHPADPVRGHGPAGVLYNFCVAPRSQGRGIGAMLLSAALDRAHARSLGALFTATTGSGALFLRHGFAPARAGLAPSSWANSLSPQRNSHVLARAL